MKFVNLNVYQMQVFVIVNNVGVMTNVIKDLFGILAIDNVNVINHVMLENNQIIKIVNAEKIN